MIKDYAKKTRIDLAVSGWHWPAIGLVMISLALIIVFLVMLLSANPNHTIKEPPVIQVNPVAEVGKVEVAKPKPKFIEQSTESNFTFRVILKQTEVKPPFVKVYESTAKDPSRKTSHVLQVASFKSETDAKELQKRLIRKQLTNVQVIKSIPKSGSVWFRVMVGPFQNRSMLNKAQDMLVQMNFSPLERKNN